MRFFAILGVTISSLLSFLSSAKAEKKILFEDPSTTNNQTDEQLKNEVEYEIDLEKYSTSKENIESFLNSMNLDYKVIGFDGKKITLQLPLKNQIVLSTQILAN